MRQHTTFFVMLVALLGSCDRPKQEGISTLSTAFDNVISRDTVSLNAVSNTSFTTSTGEKVLRHEVILEATLEEVWNAFATEQGLTAWQIPVVQLDFRIGGSQQSHYNRNATIGDKGTITNNITNYVPMELITYKINLTEAFPKKSRNENQQLQEIIQFTEIGQGKVKVIGSMLGWGQGPEWRDIYSKFEKGNHWTYEQLFKRFTTGPVKW